MNVPARRAIGRTAALTALGLTLDAVLPGAVGAGTRCVPAGGWVADLGVRLALVHPDAACSAGSVALTAAGLVAGTVAVVALLLAAGGAGSAARRVWLAGPARTAWPVLLLRRLAAQLAAFSSRPPVVGLPAPAPPTRWVPSLRLRRGPPRPRRRLPA